MLIQLTNTKGKDYWVNPLYVKAITTKKPGQAEVFITFGGAFDAVTSIKVNQDASQVAQVVSEVLASMGVNLGSYAAQSAVEDASRQEAHQHAAIQAATMGG